MNCWNTDLAAAPKGTDVIVAIWNCARDATHVDMGALFFEPYEWEEGEESEDGYFDVHEGERVEWNWNVGMEGHTAKSEIAAWWPAPAPYTPALPVAETMTAPADPKPATEA